MKKTASVLSESPFIDVICLAFELGRFLYKPAYVLTDKNMA